MCELFAMSAKQPTTVSFSLHTFAQRGGATAHHGDGWGIGYYLGRDVIRVREVTAAALSPTVTFVEDKNDRTNTVIAHVRKATQGSISLANTQPFRRELAGKVHLFAHNGDLTDYRDALKIDRFHPIGDTDSEVAFCALLEMLVPLWAEKTPSILERLHVLEEFASRIRPLGPANFLYSDGDALFVHGHKRTQPGGEVRPPGLFHLCRSCEEQGEQEVHLVASVPLTDEHWLPVQEGEILVLRNGAVVEPRLTTSHMHRCG